MFDDSFYRGLRAIDMSGRRVWLTWAVVAAMIFTAFLHELYVVGVPLWFVWPMAVGVVVLLVFTTEVCLDIEHAEGQSKVPEQEAKGVE